MKTIKMTIFPIGEKILCPVRLVVTKFTLNLFYVQKIILQKIRANVKAEESLITIIVLKKKMLSFLEIFLANILRMKHQENVHQNMNSIVFKAPNYLTSMVKNLK